AFRCCETVACEIGSAQQTVPTVTPQAGRTSPVASSRTTAQQHPRRNSKTRRRDGSPSAVSIASASPVIISLWNDSLINEMIRGTRHVVKAKRKGRGARRGGRDSGRAGGVAAGLLAPQNAGHLDDALGQMAAIGAER